MKRKKERFTEDAGRVVNDINHQIGDVYLRKRRYVSCCRAFVVNTALLNCAAGKGLAQSQYYSWSKEFIEAGKKRLAGDKMHEANADEVKVLRKEARDLKEMVAERALELRLFKKSMFTDGETTIEVSRNREA